MSDFKHVEGLRVLVNQVVYMPSLQSPVDKPHPFVYYLTVVNDSDKVIQILGRKWLVIENDGETVVVEGAGVVGEIPVLKPGEKFSYNSYHVVARSAEVAGGLYGVTHTKDGVANQKIMVEIPEFTLTCPGQQ